MITSLNHTVSYHEMKRHKLKKFDPEKKARKLEEDLLYFSLRCILFREMVNSKRKEF